MAFGQLKDMYNLQREARKMQKRMKNLKITGESNDSLVKIQINGVQEIESIDIAEELLNPAKKVDLVKGLKEAFKEASKKSQKEMAQDLNLDKMKSMLGI